MADPVLKPSGMRAGEQKGKSALANRLAAYSASAAAALALAPGAEAQVTNLTSFTVAQGSSTSTVAPSLSIPSNGATSLLFDIPAAHGLVFHAGLKGSRTNNVGSGNSTHGGLASFVDGGAGTNPGNVQAASSKLTLGAKIKGLPFDPPAGSALLAMVRKSVVNGSPGASTSGSFVPAKGKANTGYLGFKAKEDGHTYYGWLRVRVNGDSNGAPDQVSLVSINGIFGAYAPDADSIIAGELAVPEPSATALTGLGLLAVGAAGVREMRRRKAAGN